MFTLCILFKHIGYVCRGIKTNPRPKNSTTPLPRFAVLKFLDPRKVFQLSEGTVTGSHEGWGACKARKSNLRWRYLYIM